MTSSPAEVASIRFSVEPAEGGAGVSAIVPVIDGRRLTDLITEYEDSRGFDVVGGYGGIIPAYFDHGPLDRYFLGGRDHRYWGEVGKVALLGCSCGEVGCWPLHAAVDVASTDVTWRNFEQPHRRERDYSGFGPFDFPRGGYEAAVRAAIAVLAQPG